MAQDGLDALTNEIEQLRRERRHLARIAWWFAEHEPGTLVPEWCGLSWRDGEPVIEPEEMEESEAEAVGENTRATKSQE
jgi:hypothetical protein